MTCPTCSRAARDFVNSSGLLTRCDDAWHFSLEGVAEVMGRGPAPEAASPARPDDFATQTPPAPHFSPPSHHGAAEAFLGHPYTTPVPTLHDGSTGWVFCNACDAPQPVAGHECREILLPDELKRLRALLHEARRLVFFSAKDLREREGEDSVLCELVEEEQFVRDATDLLGPMPEIFGVGDAARGGGR